MTFLAIIVHTTRDMLIDESEVLTLKRVPPFVLLLIATILWGGNFVIGRAVASEVSPFTLSFLRWCTALIVFLPIAWTPLKREWPILRKHVRIVFLMAFTGVASFNTLIYIALHYTTSINASLMNTSTPILIFILSFIFLKERLNRYQMVGTVISLIGVILIISKGSFSTLLQFSFNIGDIIVMIAVICWAIYSLMVKHYSNVLPGNSTFFVSIIIGILVLFPFFIYELFQPVSAISWSMTSIFSILYTGIFASIIAFLCWNTGVIRLGANRAAIFLNFIPMFATIFAIVFIGESLQLFQLIGGAFVICGVYLSTRLPQIDKEVASPSEL